MKKYILSLCILSGLVFSFTVLPAQEKYFGDKIDDSDAISYSEFLQLMDKQDSAEVKVVGIAKEVCQMAGCWMNVASSLEDENVTFVKFKDYGFFVPKDISGKKVILQGNAFREFSTVEELRHYAEDEGKSKDEIATITEGKYELKLVASGVIVED